MDCVKGNIGKKNMITKALDRCRSLPDSRGKSLSKLPSGVPSSTKEKSKIKHRDGCFSVYVGPEKQRFVIKTESVNHPLFQMLLEDAETEYGLKINGPILLPCDVNLFYKVLAEMDSIDEKDDYNMNYKSCSFGSGSCSPFNPTRGSNKRDDMDKGFGSYGLLIPSRLIKMN